MRVHLLEHQTTVAAPLEEVFGFFSDVQNLDTITPPWLRFRVVSPTPLEVKVGVVIDYRLRVRGIPLRWRSKITSWEPPRRFVDEQIAGPYKVWIHEHTFEERDGETVVADRVRYAVPLDFLLHRLFVRGDLRRIFDYRERRLREIFGG